MADAFSERDLEKLGYDDITEQPSAVKGCQFFQATALAGLKKINARFLYVKSDCSRPEIEEASKMVPRGADLFLIYPRSVSLAPDTLKRAFPQAEAHVYDDLFWSKINTLFASYRSSLIERVQVEECYIPPRKENADPKERLDDEVVAFLEGADPATKGHILVVSASAGVGKTTLSRHVATLLAKRADGSHTIPVFVESLHWRKLNLETIDDLWDIIDNSLHTFSSLSFSEDLFAHALKRGYLAFIFDGFDELCGGRHSQFAPLDVLKELSELARESDARIVITSRSAYWKAEILDKPDNVLIADLAPFNKQQAHGYFAKYFKADQSRRDRAITLYSQLVAANQPPTQGGSRAQFVNLPVCVGMVAQFVRRSPSRDLKLPGEQDLVTEVLLQLCEREQERKSLETSAKEQLVAFEELAVFGSDQARPTFNSDEIIMAGIADRDSPAMVDHPLLLNEGPSFAFRYQFLDHFFRASVLARRIRSQELSSRSGLWDLMVAEANGKGHALEHLAGLLNSTDVEAVRGCYTSVPAESAEAKSFLFHLVSHLVRSRAVSSKERADLLLGELLGEGFKETRQVDNLYVVGRVENLDLSGIRFRRCTFVNLVFERCSVDGDTRFEQCKFAGDLEFVNCRPQEWSQVQLANSVLLSPTNLVWEEVLGVAAGSKEDNVKDALRLGLGKFWYYGRFWATLKTADWQKGSLGHSVYSQRLLEAMERVGLVSKIHISGVSEGGYLFDREYLGDLQRFMDNRQLTGKVREVYDLLIGD